MTCTSECRIPSGRGAHCGACHESFGAVSTFDAHRTGPVDHRRCLDPADAGMHRDARGTWRRDSGHPHPYARAHRGDSPQAAEPGPAVLGPDPGRPGPAETATARQEIR